MRLFLFQSPKQIQSKLFSHGPCELVCGLSLLSRGLINALLSASLQTFLPEQVCMNTKTDIPSLSYIVLPVCLRYNSMGKLRYKYFAEKTWVSSQFGTFHILLFM